MAATVTLRSKNRITLPQTAIKKLNINPGRELLVLCKEDRIVLIPKPKNFVKHMAELHSDVWKRLGATSYLRDEYEAWDR